MFEQQDREQRRRLAAAFCPGGASGSTTKPSLSRITPGASPAEERKRNASRRGFEEDVVHLRNCELSSATKLRVVLGHAVWWGSKEEESRES